ncbi:conserved Plasmodium protein, unknown function [Plasmodium knowlesi strain H]|uniref:Uncharacterized protein n=1 Tax=Plasmodium knowlesi (strain H) TaxID=5851 RepID=A0A1A7VZ57_PLAKH|nr:conserved Plasmodium protein, unknown function [Plasmodium knowlesi strain H]SBO29450.1 conserved Plasmodium protein, unknown function [Plasmodium knowlesi strain H]
MATEERVKLLVAARKGIYEDVVSLSKLQIPLGDYVQPPNNRTAFWYSCRNGNLKMARIILKKGSNINHKDANGISPLHISVKYGHLNIAKFLIENNANVDITDNEGQSPIFYAIINKHYDIVKLLIENGADVQMKDHVNLKSSESLLYNACATHLGRKYDQTCLYVPMLAHFILNINQIFFSSLKNNASVYDYADFSGKTKLSSYILYKSNEIIVNDSKRALNGDSPPNDDDTNAS